MGSTVQPEGKRVICSAATWKALFSIYLETGFYCVALASLEHYV